MLAAAIPPRIIIPPRASSSSGLSAKKWSELDTGEKIIVGSVGAVMLGALVFAAVTAIRT